MDNGEFNHCEWGLVSRDGWVIYDDSDNAFTDANDWWSTTGDPTPAPGPLRNCSATPMPNTDCMSCRSAHAPTCPTCTSRWLFGPCLPWPVCPASSRRPCLSSHCPLPAPAATQKGPLDMVPTQTRRKRAARSALRTAPASPGSSRRRRRSVGLSPPPWVQSTTCRTACTER